MTALPSTPGGPLTQSLLRYDPKPPAGDLVNLRVGLRRDRRDVSA